MKRILILCLWVIFVLLIYLIPFAYIPSMNVTSGTEIRINNVTQVEYDEMKKDFRIMITNLNPPFDCEFDKKYWKADRDSGELICQDYNYNHIYMEMKENNISIYYGGSTSFGLPTKMIITDEHKKIQKIFLNLATKYKKKYKDVKVIFYHRDLPKEGKRLL
ncbi:hypothetical protein [Arcobacter sp.]|uniref:hypothetical protein n=1 Tax=Arcobacter sp. TaxID=1872629 RepID=UPI003D15043F